MSLTANSSVGVPFFQKSVDFKNVGHSVTAFFKQRAHSGQPKVTDLAATGGLTVKAKGERTPLNLRAMYKAANPPPKVPANGGGPAPVLAGGHGIAAGGTPIGASRQGALGSTGGPGVGTGAPHSGSSTSGPPTPTEALAALKEEIATLGQEMTRIEALHGSARDGSSSPLSGNREERFLDARDALQGRIATLLKTAEAAIVTSTGDATTGRALAGTRRSLVELSLRAEFPSVGAALRSPFTDKLPDDAAEALGGRLSWVKRLDKGAHRLIEAFDDPSASRTPRQDRTLVSRLDEEISTLKGNGMRRTDSAVVAYLEDLKAAVELRLDVDAAVTHFADLRDKGVPVEKLCREITYLPGMFDMTRSGSLQDQRDAAEVVSKIAGQMSRGVVPDMLVPRDPAVASVVADLRAGHCRNLAAATFARGIQDPAFATAFAKLEERAAKTRRMVTQGEIAALLPAGSQAAFGKRMDEAGKASKLRDDYFNQLGRLQRAVGDDAAFAYKGSIWMSLSLPELASTYRAKSPLSQLDKLLDGLTGRPDMAEHQRSLAGMKKLAKENPHAAFLVAGLALMEYQVAKNDKDLLGHPDYKNISVVDFDPQRVFDYCGVTPERMEKLGYTLSSSAKDPGQAVAYDGNNRPIGVLDNTGRTEVEKAVGKEPATGDGLTSAQLLTRMHKLGVAGFGDPGDVKALQNFMQKAALEVFSNRDIQNAAGRFASESGGADRKRALIGMLSDAAAVSTGQTAPPGGDPRLDRTSAPVVDGFKKISAALDRKLAGESALVGNLAATGKVFAGAEKYILDCLDERADLDVRVLDARADLAAARGDGGPLGGLDLDPDKPAGLRSAKAIREALRYDALAVQAETSGAPALDVSLFKAARDAELDKLKGFDAETMRRPWHAKLLNVFGRAERPTIDTLRTVADVATGIIFLREGATAERTAIDGRIGDAAQLRHNLAALRMAEDPAAMLTARQMVRAAVLAHWPADNVSSVIREGKVVDAYEPALHRVEIEKTLAGWGLDTATFAPEIAVACNGTLTQHDLAVWAGEVRKVNPANQLVDAPVQRSLGARLGSAIKDELGYRFSKAGARDVALFLIANKKAMDEQFKEDIFAIHQSLKDGEKFDFKSGYKVSLNSGKVPVDPSGTIGLRMKASFAGLGNVVMERSGDGWKVTARFGVQGSLGAEVIADQRLDPLGAFAVGASVGAEGQAGILGGYTLTFPNTEQGRAACAALVQNLANGEKPSAELFDAANDNATNREISAKGGVSAKVYARAEGVQAIFGSDDAVIGDGAGPTDKSAAQSKLGGGGVASLEAAGSAGKKWKTTDSLNKVVKETERELSFGINANLNVYAKVLTLPGMAFNAVMDASGAQDAADARFNETKDGKTKGTYDVGSGSANESLLNVDLGFALQRVRKTKAEYTKTSVPGGADRLTKAEIVQRSNVTLGTEAALIGIGSGAVADLLVHDPDFRRDYMALKVGVGTDQALQITYGMTGAKLDRFNELVRTADEHSRGGRIIQAASDRRKAAAMLDNLDNFEPTKITLLKKVVQKDVANRGNAILARFDITAETSWEDSQVVIKVDPGKLAAARAKAAQSDAA